MMTTGTSSSTARKRSPLLVRRRGRLDDHERPSLLLSNQELEEIEVTVPKQSPSLSLNMMLLHELGGGSMVLLDRQKKQQHDRQQQQLLDDDHHQHDGLLNSSVSSLPEETLPQQMKDERPCFKRSESTPECGLVPSMVKRRKMTRRNSFVIPKKLQHHHHQQSPSSIANAKMILDATRIATSCYSDWIKTGDEL